LVSQRGTPKSPEADLLSFKKLISRQLSGKLAVAISGDHRMALHRGESKVRMKLLTAFVLLGLLAGIAPPAMAHE